MSQWAWYMSSASAIDKYCGVMEEAKRRIEVIRCFLTGKCNTPYRATTLETIYLQFRKVLELIALGSLVVNKGEIEKHKQQFNKWWHAERILADIEKLNSDFYPKPIRDNTGSTDKQIIPYEISPIKDGFLTREEFAKLYDICGEILHADNPFGNKVDYSKYEKEMAEWLKKIMTLLNSHTIRLLNDQNLYIVHMQEGRDNHAHAYTFEPVEMEKSRQDQESIYPEVK